MAATLHDQELYCATCDWSEVITLSRAMVWLRRAKMSGAKSDPTPEEIRELLPVAAQRLECPDCGRQPLGIRAAEDDPSDWPEAAKCEVCGQPIPPERLEIMPGVKTCVACQSRDEKGEITAEVDYCPDCGSPMQLKARHGAGIARYVLYCSQCSFRSA